MANTGKSNSRAEQMLVQMSGTPGAGKSTIARALAVERGFVVLDLDVVKSVLLENGVQFDAAGPASYQTVTALASDLLAQGHSVVIDSPLMYEVLMAAGMQLAARRGAEYRVIECVCGDMNTLDARLRSRHPVRSQRASIDDGPAGATTEESGHALFTRWMTGASRPQRGHLLLNTCTDVGEAIASALDFVDLEVP